MKVGSTGSTSASQRTRKSGTANRASGRDFADVLGQVDGAADPGVVDGPVALSGVESILAVQAINPDDGSSARQRMAQRGEDILDQLDDVRVQMLTGAIPKNKLTDLAQMVRSKREEGTDPRLGAILDEIELRAEVELAKLSRR